MGKSTERIRKFLADESNFTRYSITGLEYDQRKRVLSEVTSVQANDLKIFLPIHERWTAEKGTRLAKRPFFQLHYVANGKGELVANGENRLVSRGDVYLGFAGLEMEYSTDPKDPFEIYSFAFGGILQDELVRRAGFSKERLSYQVENRYEAEAALARLYDAATTYGAESLTAISAAYAVFALLERENGEIAEKSSKERLAYQAAELVRENYGATAVEIASACAVSPEYLSRVCREVMGISVKELITTYRMKLATNWLRYTDISVRELGVDELRYSNKKYFVKAFRTIFGMTPAQFRKTEREIILNKRKRDNENA